MPRPKGSKSKPKTIKTTVDFSAQIAEKQSAKETINAEIASITANIDPAENLHWWISCNVAHQMLSGIYRTGTYLHFAE